MNFEKKFGSFGSVLVDEGDDVGADALGVLVPGVAVLSLVADVLRLAAEQQLQRRESWQVVDEQINAAGDRS